MNKKGQSAIESPAATARRLRGQSAMEYLMTYGWAILVIIIVIAVLFYIGVLNPRNVTPTSCTFPPGISCASFKLTTSGALFLSIGQATGKRIMLTNISCTQASSPRDWQALPNINMTNGEQASLGSFQCTTADGSPAAGADGETAKFKIWLDYSEISPGTLETRQVMGDVTGRYEPA